ncbi:MAG: hypothetical protein DRI54_00675 [Bacteroidetes bacterium]|nr:MAG: hypothetical protein DRI54_00675 [Bacteroidota bacterium]
MRVYKLTSLLFLLWTSAFSQQYYFQEISMADGLANDKVYTIFEDTDHFIWMGTGYGVSVFDGTQIQNYSSNDGLAIGGVKSIYQDRFGNLLFGHYDGGLTQFRNGSFESLDSLDITGHIYKFIEYDDFLWVITDGSGAYRFQMLKESDGWNFKDSEKYMGKEGLSDRVYDIIELSSGELIFVTDAGLKKFTSENQEFNIYKKNIIPAYFQITSIFEASDSIIYIGTHNGGLYILDSKADQIKYYDEKSGLSHNFVMSLAEDKQGRIWIGTFGGGLNVLSNGEIKHFDSRNGFPDKRVQSLLVNYQGVLLAGTNASGLQIFKGFQFLNFTNIPNFETTTVFDLESVNGSLYEATEKGLLKITFNNDISYQIESVETFIPEISFKFIEPNGEKGLWLASELDEVWYFDLSDNSYRIISALRPYFRLNKITSFTKDKLNRLWIGTIDGLLMYDPATEQVERLSQENGILNNDISCVQVSGDKIWVGSRQSRAGVNYILENKVHRIELPLIITITPTAFKETDDGLWIGTENQGILVLRDDTISEIYSENEGLLSNHISFISSDKNGKLWVGNQKGLNCYLKNAESPWMSYSMAQGYMGLDCSLGALSYNRKGNMWIGTSQGAVLNFIDKVPIFEGSAPPIISEIKVDDVSIENDEELVLSYNQNEIEFKFSAVELYSPEKLKFSYKVDGLNQKWQTISSDGDRKITLFAMQPGNYTMHLKIVDYRGQISALKVPLAFTITPPWYKTTWAFVSALILIMLIIWAYIKYREQNLKIEKKILEEKVEERTHEVVIKNVQLEQKNKDITDSLHYASRIQQAVLPTTRSLEPYGFIYYRPKDIVSGDFYFIAREDKSIYICAADCTGHGVPGALLSIMGVNMMDRILATNRDISPDDFLNKLNAEVAKTLRHDETQGVNDGMDLALIKINCEENKLYYAGAYNALYIIKNKELTELKADRFSIGSQRVRKDLVYKSQSVDIEWNERVYLFSDGLADQFGGERQKKLKSSGLKNLLLSVQDYSISEQKKEISNFMNKWKESEEQIDDVLLIGLELTKELKNFKT